MSTQLHRSFAVAATVALSMSGMYAGAALATEGTQTGDINSGQTVSLTVHKYETGDVKAGELKTTGPSGVTATGIDGIVFKAHRLNLDLTKSADWSKLYNEGVSGSPLKEPADGVCDDNGDRVPGVTKVLKELQQDAPGVETTGAAVEVKTAGGGQAVFSDNMTVGAYLICEGSTADAMKGTEKVTIGKKSKPFIVTLPFPEKFDTANNNNSRWNYNPHVYPKNEVTSKPTKDMDVDPVAVIGKTDAVTVKLHSRIPSIATGEHFTYFALEDTLVKELKPSETDGNYTFTVDGGGTYAHPADFTIVRQVNAGTSNLVRVVLTKAGLTKLKADGTKTATVTFKATMTAHPEGYGKNQENGIFFNTVKSYIDKGDTERPDEPNPNTPPTPGTESEEKVASTWAKVKAQKLDAANKSVHLKGAKFKLWAFPVTPEGLQKCEGEVTIDDITKNTETTGAVEVKGDGGAELIATSGDNGLIEFPSVHIDTKKATAPAEPAPATERCFYLQEVEAPAGYILPAGKFALTPIKASSTTEATLANVTTITNTSHEVPELPLTGANGQVIMTVVGGALMTGALGVFLVLRRRNAENI